MSEENAMEEEDITSKGFTFASPSIVSSPEKVISFGVGSEHVFGGRPNQETTFTFAVPANIPDYDDQPEPEDQGDRFDASGKPYKPKISRKVYKPPVNVFTQALKDTAVFDQLKKHSRSQNPKVDIKNSITCTNVPQTLLTKSAAKEYFMNYGQILKIALRPRRRMITIYYANKDGANFAYYGSGEFLGEQFSVQWTGPDKLPKSPPKKKETGKTAVRDFLTANEDDVNAELEAMMGLEYNLHAIDTPAVVPAQKLPVVRKPRGMTSKDAKKIEKPAVKIEKSFIKTEKAEPERMESQIQTFVPKATMEELQSMIRQAAHTSEDRYKILEARDRLLRLKQIKPNTLATAKVTRGTCPDMCPEKERLMRESQRQVALYEQLDTKEYGINHTIAVKQYSRSSADQEEPLAHELRPVNSLKMTMSYLLDKIADMCEDKGTNLGEWFHFLWDRTRGIRKDITQQELCCIDSVELVEQCARFHIVCSERLCAEEPSIFDKKINTENLTKCLQTLKYMYHDLRVKGITCKNEPEFRGYIILLNLNNGNFMWDLQKLPTTIQKSPEVKFAIQVYSSIESNNFCKFFKLVHQTTYLNACILLRYFNQVRVQALSVMVKAYCRITSTAYPLYELIDILGFEDENEAIYFCEQVGLSVSNDEMRIMLNRQNLCHQIPVIEQGRAINTVESKRIRLGWTVGQCIAGGIQLEKTYKNHKPHNSFDSQGYLMPDAMNAEDQNRSNKSVHSQDRMDAYEFMEDEGVKPGQKLKPMIRTRDQTDSSSRNTPLFPAAKNMEIGDRKQTPSYGKEVSGFLKPLTVVSKTGNTTFGSKPESKITFDSKPESSLPFDAKPETKITFGSKTETSIPFGVKPESKITFGSKTETSIPFEAKPESKITFGSRTETSIPFGVKAEPNPPFGAKPEIRTPFADKTEIKAGSAKFEANPLFAMATNKGIFSGAAQGNIFAKPAAATSVFSTNRTNLQGAKSGITGGTVSSKDTFKVPQSIPDQKEQMRIDAELRRKKLEETKRQLEAETLKLQKLERERKLQIVEQESVQILEDLQNELTKEICTSIVKEEIDRIAMYKTLSTNLTDTLTDKVVKEICEELLKQEIYVRDKLLEISERIKNRMVMKYYKIWKLNATKKRRQRVALDETPVWLQRQTVEECAKLLYHPEQDLVIENMRRKRFKKDEEEPRQNALAPIEVVVHAGIKENLKSSDIEMIPNTFWKLVISWPDLENKVALWRNKKIMNEYLCPENYTEEPIIKSYKPNSYETLNLCIRSFEGLINEHNLVGTDALLFIAAGTEKLNAVKRRLTKTILSRSKLMPIPIVIVFLGEGDLLSENIEIDLDLETLLESGYVSEYTVVIEKDVNEKMILRLIQSSALWLTANKSPLVPLEMDYLNEVLNTCLTEELWLRIHGHSNFNEHVSSALEKPTFIINLHNEAVTHLIDIFLDQESLQYTDFPPELKRSLNRNFELPCGYEYFNDAWKKEESRLELEQVMNSFVLPQWRYEWPVANISELHTVMTRYCQQVLTDSNYNSVSCDILSNLFLMTDGSKEPSFIDVLLEIVKEKIRLLNKNLRVVYNKNHVKHFRTLPWWFKSSVLTEYISQKELRIQNEIKEQTLIGEPFEKKQKMHENKEKDDEFNTIYEETDPLAEFCKETQERVMNVHNISRKFEDDLEEQRLKNQTMEEMLEKALLDEDISGFLTGRFDSSTKL